MQQQQLITESGENAILIPKNKCDKYAIFSWFQSDRKEIGKQLASSRIVKSFHVNLGNNCSSEPEKGLWNHNKWNVVPVLIVMTIIIAIILGSSLLIKFNNGIRICYTAVTVESHT